jgi:hypothetical protein
MGFSELSNRLKVLSNSLLIEMIEDILNDMEVELVEMNKEQLEQGVKADNTLMPSYSDNTLKYKEKKGSLIALYDTGDFWASFFATASMGLLEMDATDWKRDMLVEEYGSTILGLTPENLKRVSEHIAIELRVKIGEYLQQ